MAKVAAETYESRRAAVVRKKQSLSYNMQSPLVALLSFKSTVLPLALKRPELWIFTAIHTVLVWMVKKNKIDDILNRPFDISEWDLSFASVGVSSTLMGFLLVFFNGQCFSRYQGYYDACTGISGTCQEIGQLTAIHLAKHADLRWDVMRYLVSSALLVYMKVTDPPGKEGVDEAEWDRLLSSEEEWQGVADGNYATMVNSTSKLKRTPTLGSFTTSGSPPLLTEEEKAILVQLKGNAPTVVLLTWAMKSLRVGYKSAGVEAPIYNHAEGLVLNLRRNCAYITNNLAMPIPFPYFHALVTLMLTNYVLYSIAFLSLESWITPVALFIIIIVSTGVREVSSALANPFGDDEVDFPVQKYIADLRDITALLSKQMQWQPKEFEVTVADPTPSAALSPMPPPRPDPTSQQEAQRQQMEQYEEWQRQQYEAWQNQVQFEQQRGYDPNYGEPYYVQAPRPAQRWGRHVGLCSPKYMPRPQSSGGLPEPLPPIAMSGEAMANSYAQQNGYYVGEGQQMGMGRKP